MTEENTATAKPKHWDKWSIEKQLGYNLALEDFKENHIPRSKMTTENPSATEKLREEFITRCIDEGTTREFATGAFDWIQENYIPRSDAVSKEKVSALIPDCDCDDYYVQRQKTDPNCVHCELENYGLLDLLKTPSQPFK